MRQRFRDLKGEASEKSVRGLEVVGGEMFAVAGAQATRIQQPATRNRQDCTLNFEVWTL